MTISENPHTSKPSASQPYTNGNASADDPNWPKLDKSRAFHGLAGKLTSASYDYTEADHVAVLVNYLTGFGNMVGSRPHFTVEYTEHALRLFTLLCGKTAKG